MSFWDERDKLPIHDEAGQVCASFMPRCVTNRYVWPDGTVLVRSAAGRWAVTSRRTRLRTAYWTLMTAAQAHQLINDHGATPPAGGRPRVDPGDDTSNLVVRFPVRHLEAMNAAAAASGLSRSEWVRSIIDQRLLECS